MSATVDEKQEPGHPRSRPPFLKQLLRGIGKAFDPQKRVICYLVHAKPCVGRALPNRAESFGHGRLAALGSR